jgi:hypothetical protein
MREHCARGYNMLRKIPFLAESAEIVFSHQEHFDGSGYPNGLRGNEIPVSAPASSPWPTPWTPSPATAPTARRELRRGPRRDSALLRNAVRSRRVEVFLKVPNELVARAALRDHRPEQALLHL